MRRWHAPRIVIPAKAGIQGWKCGGSIAQTPPHLDSRFRGNDDPGCSGLLSLTEFIEQDFIFRSIQGWGGAHGHERGSSTWRWRGTDVSRR